MNYQDIIHEQRPCAVGQMGVSAADRAAQFAPFAALTGFEAMVEETARTTEAAVCLEEGQIEAIDRCLRRLKKGISEKPMIFVRFFCPDARKVGGRFESRRDRVIKIDETLQIMILQNGESIRFQNILQITEE